MPSRYRAETSSATQYYAQGEAVPIGGVVPPELIELLYRVDKRGRRVSRPRAADGGGQARDGKAQ